METSVVFRGYGQKFKNKDESEILDFPGQFKDKVYAMWLEPKAADTSIFPLAMEGARPSEERMKCYAL